MTSGYTRFLDGQQSAMLATLISSGLGEAFFLESTGWSYGVERHRYEARAHQISEDDLARLQATVAEQASDHSFWHGYVDRCAAKGRQLGTTAESLARLAADALGRQELAAGWAAFAEATKELAPFLAATPVVHAALASRITEGIAADVPDPGARETAAAGLPNLLARSQEPATLREVRAFYRVIAEIMENPDLLDVLRSTSPAVALNRMQSDFTEAYELMRRHTRAYGWLASRSHRCEPRTPKELVERMQVVALRWKPETAWLAAERKAPPDAEQLLGFPPSAPLRSLIRTLQDLVALPSARIDVHLQANCTATAFFTAMADFLGCTRDQLLFASADEVGEALAGGAGLPVDEIDRRIINSFKVERTRDVIRLQAQEAPLDASDESEVPVITGMTASRGRAIGTVRVILAAPQVHRLEVGDVLVTATSTPDAMGGESVFPTRAGPPLGVDNAAAIVTDEGGFLSHAAILARERGIPCIVGTELATTALSDGQVVEIDATQAIGRVIPLSSS